MNEYEYYYRYDYIREEWPLGENCWIQLWKFQIMKRTPKGVWIWNNWIAQEQFICDSWRKKWAYPTIEEAKEGYLRRKEAYERRLMNRLNQCREELRVAREGKWDDKSIVEVIGQLKFL